MIVHQNCVVRLAGFAYHVKQPAVLHLPADRSNDLSPAVVITLPRNFSSSGDFLEDKLKAFEAVDDVYAPVFAATGNFIFQYSEHQANELEKVQNEMARLYGTEKVTFSLITQDNSLSEGPYFRWGDAIHQAWRLYSDDLRAFVVATIPFLWETLDKRKSSYLYEPLLATSIYGDELAVAVPSRLYALPTPELPLNGKRISIKDNMHLAGVKTSMGNRAYVDFYGPQEETAAYVKRLIDNGAVIIGKSKMNAFAGSEKPPNQAIDYFPPWNPRADGYLRPAGSSSGAGASVAGYSWCDYAIGADTTGSGREPARACGTHGLRLTTHILPTQGLVPSAEDFDSFAFLTRSANDLYELTKISTGSKLTEIMPTKILYPVDWLPYQMEEQQKMNDDFLAAVEVVLGIKHTKICLADIWKQSPPKAAQSKSIGEFLKNSGFWPMYYDNYHNFDQFRSDYETRFDKEVYVSPSQKWKWDLGSKVTEEERKQGLSEIATYKKWIAEHVLTKNTQGESDAVILLPLGSVKPDYRDIESGPPSVVESFDSKYFASVLGLPQIVVPIGQIQYDSRISKRREWVPVIATIAGAQGSDMTLIKLTQLALEKANWPTEVQTGRNMFPVAKDSRYTQMNASSKLA